ncbi:DUF2589 domain-containing protein [Azovibrio restrictus]|uniref:DUF2589 domain-containing protein n=1 Tax=Azovibrio restrictus TaxID=146938 RepID=UPI0026F1F685|nr:DUF2589 domain-containing protein [Azovibrio restrictus]MDD3483786.1 DUF2589 domain-containing protein [Azovibrio restrictus]
MDEQQKLTRESPEAAGAEPLNEADLARVDGAGQGQQSKYHVEVHSDASMPEGLARVLDIIQGAIKPRF